MGGQYHRLDQRFGPFIRQGVGAQNGASARQNTLYNFASLLIPGRKALFRILAFFDVVTVIRFLHGNSPRKIS